LGAKEKSGKGMNEQALARGRNVRKVLPHPVNELLDLF
jgi:hypothetical protein